MSVPDDDEAGDKYAFRAPLHVRLLQRFAPWAAPGLPVTVPPAHEAQIASPNAGQPQPLRRQRRKRSMDPRKVLIALSLLSCVATMVMLYSRLSPLREHDDAETQNGHGANEHGELVAAELASAAVRLRL